MSLGKSKCWYSNNCLQFLNCVVPLSFFGLATVLATFQKIGQVFLQSSDPSAGGRMCMAVSNDLHMPIFMDL
jgi:hypothetical protein